jgi:hypothetical protein
LCEVEHPTAKNNKNRQKQLAFIDKKLKIRQRKGIKNYEKTTKQCQYSTNQAITFVLFCGE